MQLKIARYELIDVIGAGGFASVYRAFDPSLDSEVAVKVLAENWSLDADIRSRFIQEAQLMRRLDHRRFVQIYDIGESDAGQPFFVMRLARLGTLAGRFDAVAQIGTVPSPADIARLVDELASCLERVHDDGIIHRDVKPSNLLIERGVESVGTETCFLAADEFLVLADFGLARDNAVKQSMMTISGGTGGYAAPEQMSPMGHPDERTDIYAATALICEAVRGRPTIPSEPPPAAPPGVDAAIFASAVSGGLAEDQSKRPQTSSEWKRSFDRALRPEDASALTDDPALTRTSLPPVEFQPESKHGSRQRRWMIGLVVLAVMVAVAGTIAVMSRSTDAPGINGPDEIASGVSAAYTAEFDGASSFRWTDSEGVVSAASSLTIGGVVPGEIMIAVDALDETGELLGDATKTIVVTESPDGPQILGPDRVVVGDVAAYTVDEPDASSIRWVDPLGSFESAGYEIEPTRSGRYSFSVIVVRPDGTEIGSTKQIEIVDP